MCLCGRGGSACVCVGGGVVSVSVWEEGVVCVSVWEEG